MSPRELGEEAATLAPRAWQARLVRFWLRVLSGSLCYKTFGVSCDPSGSSTLQAEQRLCDVHSSFSLFAFFFFLFFKSLTPKNEFPKHIMSCYL